PAAAPRRGHTHDPIADDPNTGKARTALANNHIPASSISPAAGKILALFPGPGSGAPVLNNFVGADSGPFKSNSYDTRIDYTVSPTLNVFGRFSLAYYTISGKGLLGASLAPVNGGTSDSPGVARSSNT